MNQAEELAKAYEEFGRKIDQVEVAYVKRKCNVCKNKELKHYRDCNHVKIDYRLLVDSVDRNKNLRKEAGMLLNRHIKLNKL